MTLKDKWNEMGFSFDANGLLPVIVQDYESGEVLMLTCINQEAAEKMIESGYVHYYDKATGTVDTFGAVEGNTQKIIKRLSNSKENFN